MRSKVCSTQKTIQKTGKSDRNWRELEANYLETETEKEYCDSRKNININKLAPYGTGSRLLLTANFKITWHKNYDKNKKSGPDKL